MSNYYGYVSVDALMDFAHNHVNGMIDSNDIARFPKANVKDANEQQSLQEIFGVSFDRLRELAEAERNGTNWIMPCKRGDTVYRIVGQKGKKRVGSRTVLSVTKYDTSVSVFTTVSDILGKTVFLTQAEAERALAATEPKGDAR